jgi:predicted transcriptional regulator
MGGENLGFPIMIQLTFTDEEIEKLHYERFHPPHPRVQRKMEALYLKSQKYRHKEITKLLRITEPTLLNYLQDYKAGGIAKLKELTFNRPQSEMKQHQESIESYFREHPSSCSRNNCRINRDCPQPRTSTSISQINGDALSSGNTI